MFLSSAKGHTSPWENTPQVWYNQPSGYICSEIHLYTLSCFLLRISDVSRFKHVPNQNKQKSEDSSFWGVLLEDLRKFQPPWVTPSQTVFLQKYLAVDTAKCKNLSFTADSATFVELYHFSCQYVPTEKRSLGELLAHLLAPCLFPKSPNDLTKRWSILKLGSNGGGTVSTPSIVSRYRMESNATSVDILYQVIQA